MARACIIMAALTTALPVERRRQLFIVLAHLVHGEQDDVAEACLNVVRLLSRAVVLEAVTPL